MEDGGKTGSVILECLLVAHARLGLAKPAHSANWVPPMMLKTVMGSLGSWKCG